MASIKRKANGDYIIRVYHRQQQKSTTYHPTANITPRQLDRAIEQEATRLISEIEAEQERRDNPGQTPFIEFSQKWFNNYAGGLRATTQRGYNIARRRIDAYFGKYTLQDITPELVIGFITALQTGALDSAAGARVNKTSGPLSVKTVRNHLGLLSSILSSATEWKLISDNPVSHVKPPRLPHKSINIMTDTDLQKFITALNKSKTETRALFVTELYTGLRRGELCGIMWNDVDFSTGAITIQRAVQYTPARGVFIDELKNGTSYRTIYIPREVLDILMEYRRAQDAKRVVAGLGWADSGFVFTNSTGGPLLPNIIYTRLRRFLKANGLAHVSLHSLRHTHASQLIAAGVDVKTVSARLGHSSVATTTEIYASAVQRANVQAADKLTAVFSSLSSQNPPE